MKIVAMIPVRLGSTRVKNKNLRMIDKNPLIQYIVDSALQSEYLDDIYINSESPIFKGIANHNNIQFYQRDKKLASDKATNDDFALDFIDNVECDVLIQLLATSPFLSAEEIDGFISKMIEEKYDTMVSVSDVRIECIYKKQPINFDQKKQTPPSQFLEPIKAYACGIMGWKTDIFKKNMEKNGSAYHGGDGKTGFFELKGFSTVDIDNEDDFILAEAIAKSRNITISEPEYYDPEKEKEIFDSNVARILDGDGVLTNVQDSYNLEKVSIKELIDEYGREKSWSHTVINSPSNSATLIAQLPGEGNRMHYHHDWDEWWYIIEGTWEWLIEGKVKRINAGEVIFIERNRKHQITACGNKMAIRLAVSRYDVDHVYTSSKYLE
jgi:CMP-N-acetylneuraminic acid synthetase/quercetin dioxygenase-like cupin family protein